MKRSNNRNVFGIRKKMMLASKLMGVIVVVSYMFFTGLPLNMEEGHSTDISFIIWLVFVTLLICGFDLWMTKFITEPVSELNNAAGNRTVAYEIRHCHGLSGQGRIGFGSQ